jgi:putative transposase
LLTFCCDGRRKVFTDGTAVDLVMAQFLRAAGDENVAIIVCCFMPDHVHLVVEGQRDDSDLKRFISRAKQLSGYHYKSVHEKRLWQRYGHERALRTEESTGRVAAYVLENPVRAGLAATVYDYPFIKSGVYGREALIEYAYGTVRLKPDTTTDPGRGPAEAGYFDRSGTGSG